MPRTQVQNMSLSSWWRSSEQLLRRQIAFWRKEIPSMTRRKPQRGSLHNSSRILSKRWMKRRELTVQLTNCFPTLKIHKSQWITQSEVTCVQQQSKSDTILSGIDDMLKLNSFETQLSHELACPMISLMCCIVVVITMQKEKK